MRSKRLKRMTEEIALDTSVLVEHFRNSPTTTRRIEKFGVLWIPVPVIAEMLFGFQMLKNSESRKKEFESFILKTNIIECDVKTAEHFSNIKAVLQRKGALIRVNDMWIAACCITRKKSIATKDVHFRSVPGLTTIMWD